MDNPTHSFSGERLYPFCGVCGAKMRTTKGTGVRGLFWQCSKEWYHDAYYVRPLTHAESPFDRETGARR